MMKGDLSFGKKRRIKESKEFKLILRHGKSFISTYYKYFFQETSNSYSRLGVVASRRIGSAVKRNYEKRIVREFFRTADLNNVDLIVIVCKKNGTFHSKQRDFLSFINYIKI